MSPKLRSLLARVILVGGVAFVASYVARSAPHEQTLVIRIGSRDLQELEAVVTRAGDAEPTVGFSEAFAGVSPRTLRHTFSAANGTYIVVITSRERQAGEQNPIRAETTFERQVNLVGGEVIVSPD